MYILRSSAVEFTLAQTINKLGAYLCQYRYALDRRFADCGRRQGKLKFVFSLKIDGGTPHSDTETTAV
jgi:hypothetical protein